MKFDKWINCQKENEKKLAHWVTQKEKGSKGEQHIRKFLRKYSIPYKEQFTFNDLYYKNPDHLLRFDFKIWWKDKTFLLEVDGGQHKKTVNWNGKLTQEEMEESLKENMERDELKNEYCKKNSIPLYRIEWNGNESALMKDFRNVLHQIH